MNTVDQSKCLQAIEMEAKDSCNPETYHAALARVSDLIDLDPTAESPEGEELRVLGTLVQAYEATNFPVPGGSN